MLTCQCYEPVRDVVNRTYNMVITPTMQLEIYRNDIAGDWHLQRVLDQPGAGTIVSRSRSRPAGVFRFLSRDAGTTPTAH